MVHFAFAIYSIAFSVLSGTLAVALISLPATYAILKQMDWSEPDKRHAAKPDRWYIR